MANRIETTFAAVNGGLPEGILTGKSPVYSYDGNGKRTSEIPTAHKITVALLGNRLTPLAVKIDGSTDPLPEISDEQIDLACRGDNDAEFIFVSFKNAVVSIYSIDRQMVMSGKAEGVQISQLIGK